MSKFTNRPWTAEFCPACKGQTMKSDGTGVHVDAVVVADTLNCDYRLSLEEANARLMSAGPDLWDALRAAWPVLLWAKERGALCGPTIKEVEAALTKGAGGKDRE